MEEGREGGREEERHININNLSLSERERERGEKGGRLNREMNIKQTEMEGGERQHRDAYKTERERRRDGGKRQYGGMNMKQVEM